VSNLLVAEVNLAPVRLNGVDAHAICLLLGFISIILAHAGSSMASP
jgi:hypothetical protein